MARALVAWPPYAVNAPRDDVVAVIQQGELVRREEPEANVAVLEDLALENGCTGAGSPSHHKRHCPMSWRQDRGRRGAAPAGGRAPRGRAPGRLSVSEMERSVSATAENCRMSET